MRIKKCPICRNDHSRRGKTCSKKCAALLRAETAKTMPRICVLCGEQFFSKDGTGKYCSENHYKKCEICATEFMIRKGRESKKNPTCGPKCGAKYTHTDSSRNQRRINNLKKFGVEHTFQREDVKAKIRASEKHKETLYGSKGFKDNLLSKHGVRNGFLLPKANPAAISNANKKWAELLTIATGLEWVFEYPVENVGNIDLFCENNGRRVAVEINPTPTHNSFKHLIACNKRGCKVFPCEQHAKNKYYHYDRLVELEKDGISLVSVFDWHSEEKMVSFIKSKLGMFKHRIGAKKCVLKRIDQTSANRFLKEFHLMNGSRKQEYCYGLFFSDELIQVQTFAEIGENIWEARRIATRNDWQVIGGISKGTKQFIKDASPVEIVAFSDLNLGFTNFDSKYNGFRLDKIMPPVKCWSKKNEMILDKTAAFQSADRLLKIAKNSRESVYDENLSNEDVFLAEGWLPVWDCGKIREVWVSE